MGLKHERGIYPSESLESGFSIKIRPKKYINSTLRKSANTSAPNSRGENQYPGLITRRCQEPTTVATLTCLFILVHHFNLNRYFNLIPMDNHVAGILFNVLKIDHHLLHKFTCFRLYGYTEFIHSRIILCTPG